MSEGIMTLKRVIDFVVTVIGLCFASIPLAMVALAVRLSSDAPILFRQTRVGFAGRDFTLLEPFEAT